MGDCSAGKKIKRETRLKCCIVSGRLESPLIFGPPRPRYFKRCPVRSLPWENRHHMKPLLLAVSCWLACRSAPLRSAPRRLKACVTFTAPRLAGRADGLTSFGSPSRADPLYPGLLVTSFSVQSCRLITCVYLHERKRFSFCSIFSFLRVKVIIFFIS